MLRQAEQNQRDGARLGVTVVVSLGTALLVSLLMYLAMPGEDTGPIRIGIVDSRRLITSFEGTLDALAMLEVGRNEETGADSTLSELAPSSPSSSELDLQDPSVVGPLFATINQLIEQYSVENGYDLILGTTDDGSILYGAEAVDITDDLLQYINQGYRAE